VLNTSVVVDRPAEVVWPVLIDQRVWKSGIGALEHVGGDAGKEGELRFMTPANAGPEHGYLIETVRVVPAQQLVLKIYPRDRAAFIGFAAFTLSESDGKTRVNYDVYVEYRMNGTTPEQRTAFAKQMHEDTKARLQAENLALKKLVERAMNNGPQAQ
ncbi:MAG: hypothetical protein ACREUC_10455, partial [Steroidobacteraceae bacterium]